MPHLAIYHYVHERPSAVSRAYRPNTEATAMKKVALYSVRNLQTVFSK